METVGKPGFLHYLSHRAMIKNECGTTKTCIVFNASSKIGNNPSLNDCLQSSPHLLPLIFNILLRFRIGGLGLVAHIKQVFLNIEIGEGHRDFGWKIFQKRQNSCIQILKSGIWVTSSPFLLEATIKSHVTKYIIAQIAVVQLKTLLRDMYVDVATGFCTMNKGLEFYFESKKCLKEGGF